MATLMPMKMSRNRTSAGSMPSPVKLCTLVSPSTPLRVRKVLYRTRMKVMSVSRKVVKSEVSLRLFTSMRCPAATSVIHGTKEAFSTGSHAQKPPKLSDS